MSRRPVVLMATEGTYPFHPGGVSTWCDTLVHRLSDFDFIVYAIAMNPYVAVRFDLPENVRQIIAVPLWGMQDPSEHRGDVRYSEIFLKKQRTTPAVVDSLFLPLFHEFLTALDAADAAGRLGPVLAAMYRYFQAYDYWLTFKHPALWTVFKEWVVKATEAGRWDEPTIYESVQALGWIYHFLIVLNTAIPEVDLIHSSAAAFCGVVGIVGKIQYGIPYLLTEHGVYLREQYLAVGRSNLSPFSKRFLLALIRTVVQENLHYADQLAPVCAFNVRWERRLGADSRKIRVIYNGVDPQRFYPASPQDKTSDEALRVLAVARVDPNKDLETFLRAVDMVHRAGLPLKGVVQGSVSVPEYFQEMLALRNALGLQSVVDFSGHTDNIADEYRRADIVVQSSLTEAFPYSVLESMMCGVPMVATDVGGTREALADTGVLVPSRDPGRLALGLMMLGQDKALRETLGQKARRRAMAFFTIQKTMAQFRHVYRILADKKAPDTDRERLALTLTKAYAFIRLGLFEEALTQLQAALEFCPWPTAPAILAEMAQVQWRRGDRQSAIASLVKARLVDELGRAASRPA